MLNLYRDTIEAFLKVPHIDENFFVNERGEFYEMRINGYVLIPLPEDRHFNVHVAGVECLANVANLIQITWKPVFHGDVRYYLSEREVLFIDKNHFNLHPSNLIWGFEISLVDDMYRIPGFSWYLLTKDNLIYSRVSDSFLSVSLVEERHATAYISPDYKCGIGNSIGTHRIVAFSQLEYTRQVCNLDVNHLDGNKWNYSLDNLEWATRQRNNLHAQMTGLKKDGNTVKVTDLQTGESHEYFSQAECARTLKLDPQFLSMRLINGGGKFIYENKYEIEVIKVGLEKPKHLTSPRISLVKNITTGEIHEFPSMNKAAHFLGLKPATVKQRHLRGTTVFGNMHLKTYNPLLGESRPTFNEV